MHGFVIYIIYARSSRDELFVGVLKQYCSTFWWLFYFLVVVDERSGKHEGVTGMMGTEYDNLF